MKLENEICRKVYDHHDVLKGEMGTALFEILTRAKLDKESISAIINVANVAIDSSSSKMTADYQRFFAAQK